ncbi:MAG: hypothetical protein BRD49_02835, partial [Bacteroidetes bacterium SW_10_40_5]
MAESSEEHSNRLDQMFRKYNPFAAKPNSINSNKHFDVHPPVFWVASFLAVLFIAITIIIGGDYMYNNIFEPLKNGISNTGGWFFVL